MDFKPIEIVNTDKVGQLKSFSVGKIKYFVTLLEEISRFPMVRLVFCKYKAGEAVE